VNTAELLTRLSATLKEEVGPAVEDGYVRTQAFMAAVILERVARQVELEPAHRAAERADVDELLGRLTGVLAAAAQPVRAALDDAHADGTVAGLAPLVEALYRDGIGSPATIEAMALIRPVLRRDIDRRMQVAQ
jgi:hypothetical protein